MFFKRELLNCIQEPVVFDSELLVVSSTLYRFISIQEIIWMERLLLSPVANNGIQNCSYKWIMGKTFEYLENTRTNITISSAIVTCLVMTLLQVLQYLLEYKIRIFSGTGFWKTMLQSQKANNSLGWHSCLNTCV